MPEYFYYDTPDGQDCEKKLKFMTKFSVNLGTAAFILDQGTYYHPQPFSHFWYRAFCCYTPIVGMGTAYTITTCFLCKEVPSLDRKISAGIGACVASSVWGAWKRNAIAGLNVSLPLTLAAILWQWWGENNFINPIWGTQSERPSPMYPYGGYEWSTLEVPMRPPPLQLE